jgi:hypothetical protein
MFNEYMKAFALIAPITLATAFLEVIRILLMKKPLGAALGEIFGYLLVGFVFGWIAIQVYHWIGNRWPQSAAQVYFWLAAGLAILLTVMAVIMPIAFKSPWSDVVLWTLMNALWGLGYGWFLPQILAAPKAV